MDLADADAPGCRLVTVGPSGTESRDVGSWRMLDRQQEQGRGRDLGGFGMLGGSWTPRHGPACSPHRASRPRRICSFRIHPNAPLCMQNPFRQDLPYTLTTDTDLLVRNVSLREGVAPDVAFCVAGSWWRGNTSRSRCGGHVQCGVADGLGADDERVSTAVEVTARGLIPDDPDGSAPERGAYRTGRSRDCSTACHAAGTGEPGLNTGTGVYAPVYQIPACNLYIKKGLCPCLRLVPRVP